MYYMVERKYKGTDPICFAQLGIVVATSLEEAAAKIGGEIVSVGRPPETSVACAELKGGYWLEEIEEVTFLPSSSGGHLEEDEEWTR